MDMKKDGVEFNFCWFVKRKFLSLCPAVFPLPLYLNRWEVKCQAMIWNATGPDGIKLTTDPVI